MGCSNAASNVSSKHGSCVLRKNGIVDCTFPPFQSLYEKFQGVTLSYSVDFEWIPDRFAVYSNQTLVQRKRSFRKIDMSPPWSFCKWVTVVRITIALLEEERAGTHKFQKAFRKNLLLLKKGSLPSFRLFHGA